MSATTAIDTYSQAPKFSRYRSVRKAASAVIAEDVPEIPVTSTAQINRAPSRYHRTTRQRTQTIPLPTQPVPNKVPTEIQSHATWAHSNTTSARPNATLPLNKSSPPQQDHDHDFVGGPVQNQEPSGTVTPRNERHLSRNPSTRSTNVASPRSYEAAREEARMILEGEYDRLQKIKEMQKKYERKKDPEVPELKRRPTQVQPPKPQPVFVDAPKLNVKRRVDRTLPDKFHDAPQSIGPKQQLPEQPAPPNKVLEVKYQGPVKSYGNAAPSAPTTKQFDAPKFDAPISAVNAGDRRVEVRLNHANRGITLPVTPTTNSRDLLNSASIVMSETFDPRTSILVESFSREGLERPLRRYEHIRDVMNSWDSDDQNHLTIMTNSECQATGLDRSEAPEDPPGRNMLQMYISSRPGKWDKRWIILRDDGQVTMSKHENDGEATNICHLSDFDVYTPTAKQRKKLKPPKKTCFAVKSQQKSSMFLEGANYVHFFATSDKQTADQWYTAIQTWRSWYLVHVLGEGTQKAKESHVASGNGGTTSARPVTAQSTDSVPYQLGSFKPLLDFSDLDFSASFSTDADVKAKNEHNGILKKHSIDVGPGRPSFDVGPTESARRGSRPRAMPPSSFPSKLVLEAENKCRISLEDTDQAFTGGGLLGRNASIRRLQGGKSSGYGVAGVPGRPLVDLAPASDFMEGSLLRKLEAWSTTQGENELKIDRQKRVEANVRVGEGL